MNWFFGLPRSGLWLTVNGRIKSTECDSFESAVVAGLRTRKHFVISRLYFGSIDSVYNNDDH